MIWRKNAFEKWMIWKWLPKWEATTTNDRSRPLLLIWLNCIFTTWSGTPFHKWIFVHITSVKKIFVSCKRLLFHNLLEEIFRYNTRTLWEHASGRNTFGTLVDLKLHENPKKNFYDREWRKIQQQIQLKWIGLLVLPLSNLSNSRYNTNVYKTKTLSSKQAPAPNKPNNWVFLWWVDSFSTQQSKHLDSFYRLVPDFPDSFPGAYPCSN